MHPIGFAQSTNIQIHSPRTAISKTAVSFQNSDAANDSVHFGIRKLGKRTTLTLVGLLAAAGLAGGPEANATGPESSTSPVITTYQPHKFFDCTKYVYPPSAKTPAEVTVISPIDLDTPRTYYQLPLSAKVGSQDRWYYLQTLESLHSMHYTGTPKSMSDAKAVLNNAEIQQAAKNMMTLLSKEVNDNRYPRVTVFSQSDFYNYFGYTYYDFKSLPLNKLQEDSENNIVMLRIQTSDNKDWVLSWMMTEPYCKNGGL